MGIFCEINLFKPSHEVYHPGQVISGVIKYTLDEPMEVDRITTSLKGVGSIVLTTHPHSKHETNYRTKEHYVDVDTIIQDKQTEISVGSYEVRFTYTLPQNIPSSMKYKRHLFFRDYKVKCSIKYYIRIKFERPGLFALNKHFRKEIKVISDVAPRLSREPLVYELTKPLTQLFSIKDSSITIKATILNSTLTFGGRIVVHYEVQNNSHVVVKSIKAELVEIYTFKAKGHHKVSIEEDLPYTKAKSTSINCKNTQKMSIDLNVPPQLYSLENSKIVSRCYAIRITAQLPIPYKNAVFDIPVQIGVLDGNVRDTRLGWTNEDTSNDDDPPSYWEAMGETKKEDDDGSDDEINNVNGAK